MSIKFKILSVDSNSHSMVVRYFSDLVSEDNLASEFDLNGNILKDQNGSPVRCRTDYNISIRDFPSPSEERLIEIASEYAPKDFFNTFEKVNDPGIDTSLSAAVNMINTVYNVIEKKPEPSVNIEQMLNQLVANNQTSNT